MSNEEKASEIANKYSGREIDRIAIIEAMKWKDEQKPAEWSKQQVVNTLTNWLNEKIAPLHKKSLDGTITEREDMFETALVEMRSFVNSPAFQIGKDTSIEWSEEDEKQARQIERIVHSAGCAQKLQKQIADWLKSLKQRMKGEQL